MNEHVIKEGINLWPQGDDDPTFFIFPYNELAKRLDQSTHGLLIFDHPFFKFFDRTSFLQKLVDPFKHTHETIILEITRNIFIQIIWDWLCNGWFIIHLPLF